MIAYTKSETAAGRKQHYHPQLCFPAVARGVWPGPELICFPNSVYKTVFCLLLAQSCSPAVFSILFPNTCSPIVFPSLFPTCFPDCCFPALPTACPQLYPTCFQLFPQLVPSSVSPIIALLSSFISNLFPKISFVVQLVPTLISNYFPTVFPNRFSKLILGSTPV